MTVDVYEPTASSFEISQHTEVRTGVVLFNLGTPDAPTTQAVRRYLIEFLSDRRVVELPPLLWQPLLRLLIAPLRARTSAQKYELVWLPEGSPLRVHTEQQVKALQAHFDANGQKILVQYAMRYGSPSMENCFDRLERAGVKRILLVPMYPQYAASTTASVWDKVWNILQAQRVPPEIQTIAHYADFPPYIDALVGRIQTYWAEHKRPNFANGDRLLLSFHGLPKRMVERGDPYANQCQTTAALLREALSLTEEECLVTFQSQFGPTPWLQPYTVDTLRALGAASVKRVDVFCPGFTADCLETIEEIGCLGRETFLHAGGKSYHRIACLNADPLFIECLAALVEAHSPRKLLNESQAPSDKENGH